MIGRNDRHLFWARDHGWIIGRNLDIEAAIHVRIEADCSPAAKHDDSLAYI